MKSKSKGLGDSLEKVFKATGIDKVAKKVLGDDCGCEERKEKLNKLFPYTKSANKFTEDEKKVFNDTYLIVKKTNQLTNEQKTILSQLHIKAFGVQASWSSCGSCNVKTLDKLAKVYEISCENEKSY